MQTQTEPSPVADTPLGSALVAARQGVDDVLAADPSSLGSTTLVESVDAVLALRRAAEAAYLHVLAEVDRRGVSTDAGTRSTAAWLRQRHKVSGAGADVAAAQTVASDGELAELGEALAQGAVSRQHVDVAVRCLSRVPASLLATKRAEVAAFLTGQARRLPPQELEAVAKALLAVLDPDGDAGFDPDAVDRRSLTMATDVTGMLVGRFQLDPATAAVVAAALHHFAAPQPATRVVGEDGQRVLGIADRRSNAQRYADALGLMARAAMRNTGGRGGEPPRVVVHTTPEQLAGRSDAGLATCEQTGPVPAAVLHRLACDAVLERVTIDEAGHILDYGRTRRLASTAQRKALAVRDGGCAIPGCGALPSWCDAHHVRSWVPDGPTDLDNLVLLCPAHHTGVHLRRWRIEMRDGLPWVIPPRQIDPQQRPVRNELPDAVRQAHRLAEQLSLDDTG